MLDIFKEFPIQKIEYNSDYFPNNFKTIPDCPNHIYAIGDKSLLNSKSIAIVGTRYCTNLGLDLAFKFSKDISEYNLTIVSGMAMGIDRSAHNGAIEKGKTIAVIAGGFSKTIVNSNLQIALKILRSGGCIITEYEDDIPPQDFTFLKRNRLIAAISEATIVIEAPLKSGAISTATYALKYGKPLYAVPYSLNCFKGEGCNKLIESGAKALINSKTILEAFASNYIQTDLFKEDKKNRNIPNCYLEYYDYIKDNSPVSEEQILSFFDNKSVSEITTALSIMEINNYVYYNDNLYYI